MRRRAQRKARGQPPGEHVPKPRNSDAASTSSSATVAPRKAMSRVESNINRRRAVIRACQSSAARSFNLRDPPRARSPIIQRHGRATSISPSVMRAEPPRHGLRGRVLAIDAVDDPRPIRTSQTTSRSTPAPLRRHSPCREIPLRCPSRPQNPARPADSKGRRVRQTCRLLSPRPRTCRSHAAPNVPPSSRRCASRPSAPSQACGRR